MHITHKDLKKYIIISLSFIWLVLFWHLFYKYIEKISTPKPVKGWIFLEWVITQNIINPFPYIWNNYYSKYVQSYLFKSCLNDLWKDELCKVSTKDRKTFIVTLTGNNYRSDWRKITADDVFFTYENVIKNNSFWLNNPIPNNIDKVEKINNKTIKVTFKNTTVNNWNLFKEPILPAHILIWATKDYYVYDFTKNLINSTCVKIDPATNYKDKLILDFNNCKNYFINKYQFNLFNKENQIKNYLTWNTQLDAYDWYENILPWKFKKFEIKLPIRYALFWNVQKNTNPIIKAYLSNQIINKLKQDFDISNKVDFNWYGLFQLSKVNFSSWDFKNLLLKNLIQKQQDNFKSSLEKIEKIYKYQQWNNNKAYIENKLKDKLIIEWTLLTWYDKIWIQANSGNIYILRTYKPNSKKFKYVISEKFWNIKEWKNTYKIFGINWQTKKLVDTITIFYKKIIYPNFQIKAPDFKIVYLDKPIISSIWDDAVQAIKQVYPWKVIWKKVQFLEYKQILASWDYNLVIANINLEWKDISSMFLSKNPLDNPSKFVNPNFASLINQDLLVEKKLKKEIFKKLNLIYQQTIPVVIIWNEKIWLFIQKKYNPKNLDYSYFSNRHQFIQNVVLTKIKQPAVKKASLKWFIQFLKDNIK